MRKNIPFKLGKNFEKIIEPQLKKPEIAILELISNSWDAYAHNIKIQWPKIEGLKGNNEKFTILDDGNGMSEKEFLERWTQIGYVKKEQNNEKCNTREIIGKNGRGRLGLFCFSDSYIVSTSKDEKVSTFKIKREPKSFAKIDQIEPITHPFENDEKLENGTYIECPIEKDYIDLRTVKETITLRFGADPSFNVYLNDEKINLFDFREKSEYELIYYSDEPIRIYKIPKNINYQKLYSYEVVWWVKNRFVEQDKWKNLNINLDSANKKENQYVFLICANFLEDEVKSDWMGFKDTTIIKDVKKIVSNKINEIMRKTITTSLKEKKKNILKNAKSTLITLNPVEREEIGKYVDEILSNCPSISNKDITNIINILAKMEKSHKKYTFFDNITNTTPNDLDKLTEIVEKWSIDDAYLVLNELYSRLELIKKLELLVNDPSTKELLQLQPLFKEGLWIFHPKYEGTTRFTSNQTINKVMTELLHITDYHSENSKLRPDFVVLEDSTISTFTSDYYVDDSEVIDGYDELLIMELKKGNSIIGFKEKSQALNYAKEIKKKGRIGRKTKINVYVLGSMIEPGEEETTIEGNVKIKPRQYDLVIKTAKNRTFNLINRIKSVKGISNLGDEEINEVLKEDESQETFLD